ncbi:WRKY transcription factor 23-like [Cornus florida]|uniref:WRKY transcription factor 23-like n=1 Tax=Cornus florida TaxID=4283 RepID=UPI00289A91CB|nr:WRKY transcription factor 23-like [Cornus florida]XP_059625570.1 WRKY transcription factor 23-like [Cornus florida]XP_059625571.1 WRKY transcription factor 23-like [Cornus florida]XP_059625572.1 WRKY transcription factor 23-like [Cornus florida]
MMESMERKEAIKIEESMRSFCDHLAVSNPVTGMMGLCVEEIGGDGDDDDDEKSSLGFMELLGFQDQITSNSTSSPPSIFDVLQLLPSSTTTTSTSILVHPESSSSFIHHRHHRPTTPNSSSNISSQSQSQSQSSAGTSTTTPPNDTLIQQTKPTLDEDEDDDEDEDQHHQNNKKLLKAKKTKQKRQREPRFAFMTKSEVDHLEDGYRWRKYGQKAVKNSTFPRSYYRCTNGACNVKKRVERCFNDPSIVVTTYEGKHTHPSPLLVMSRPPASNFSSTTYAMPSAALSHQSFNSGYLTSSINNNNNPPPPPPPPPSNISVHQRRFCAPSSSALLRDQALLQDIFPSLPPPPAPACDQKAGRVVENPHQYL